MLKHDPPASRSGFRPAIHERNRIWFHSCLGLKSNTEDMRKRAAWINLSVRLLLCKDHKERREMKKTKGMANSGARQRLNQSVRVKLKYEITPHSLFNCASLFPSRKTKVKSSSRPAFYPSLTSPRRLSVTKDPVSRAKHTTRQRQDCRVSLQISFFKEPLRSQPFTRSPSPSNSKNTARHTHTHTYTENSRCDPATMNNSLLATGATLFRHERAKESRYDSAP